VRADLGFVELGSLLDVGLDEELTSRAEQTGDMVEYVRPDDESLRVPPFPPRIGKMKEGRRANHPGSVEECEPDVFGETRPVGNMTQKALVHDDRPFALDLGPEGEVSLSGRRSARNPAPGPHPPDGKATLEQRFASIVPSSGNRGAAAYRRLASAAKSGSTTAP
jgi:hypothetical protein